MRRWLVLLAGAGLAASCAAPPPPPPPPPPAVAVTAPPPPVVRPAIGSFGFDTAGMDRSIAPGDDFYGFANGGWARSTPIPPDKSNYGLFTALDDLSRERTRVILVQAAADPASRIGAAYAAFLDQPRIEARGLAGFADWLGEVRGLRSRAGYPALVGRAERMGIPGPFGFFVGLDDKQNDRYALTMVQGGLGMPDRDYYLSADPQLAAVRGKYRDHLERVLTLAGERNAGPRAAAILAHERAIARVHWTQVDSRDATKTYNKLTLAELAAAARGVDFRALLGGMGAAVGDLIVAQPSAVRGTAAVIARAPLAVLRDQLLVRSLDRYAAVLPAAFDQAQFAFYGTALSGTPQQEERWERAVDFTSGALSDEVSRIYVERHFPPATKAAADALVRNVVAAMGRRIDQLAWMAPPTRARARAKLANFTAKIGYPERWRDYSDLAIDRSDALGNAIRSARFEHDYQLGKLGGPVRRWEWGMTPMTVNAYANFTMMEVVFPASILQPPFFDPNADAATNYGGIGAVIGHEISHHFDDQGAKYDEHGRLSDWWTANDVNAFGAAGQALVAQYDAYEPLPGLRVKGAFTLGENVADLAGLTVAYDAWRATLGGREPPVIDGFTGDQRFFLGWAQVWRRNYREANLRQRLITDPHAPSPYRAAIVRNLDPWYAAFAVPPGARLYLPPARRVRIW